jgi:putative SOS response-associated peptidase YedK
VIGTDDRDLWLDRGTTPGAAARLLRPAPDGLLGARRVSTRVNTTSEDDAGLLDPVEAPRG